MGFVNSEDIEYLLMDVDLLGLLDEHADNPYAGYCYDPGHA